MTVETGTLKESYGSIWCQPIENYTLGLHSDDSYPIYHMVLGRTTNFHLLISSKWQQCSPLFISHVSWCSKLPDKRICPHDRRFRVIYPPAIYLWTHCVAPVQLISWDYLEAHHRRFLSGLWCDVRLVFGSNLASAVGSGLLELILISRLASEIVISVLICRLYIDSSWALHNNSTNWLSFPPGRK